MIDSAHCDVTNRIRVLLAESPLSEVRKIEVEQVGDRLLLHGRVRTFYAKQVAQETIRNAARGLHIVNDVSVD